MSGLLLKDCFTLGKQLKIMLLMLLVFACMPNGMANFAILYAALLPVTALAYDERSRWDELAVMMPYSPKSIVISKYLLGVLAVLAAALVAAAAQIVIGMATGGTFAAEALLELVLMSCMALILLAVDLPFMFRLGVEKGRFAFMILVCGGVVAGMSLRERLLTALSAVGDAALPVLGALALTAVMVAASIPVSIAMYRKKKG